MRTLIREKRERFDIEYETFIQVFEKKLMFWFVAGAFFPNQKNTFIFPHQ